MSLEASLQQLERIANNLEYTIKNHWDLNQTILSVSPSPDNSEQVVKGYEPGLLSTLEQLVGRFEYLTNASTSNLDRTIELIREPQDSIVSCIGVSQY